MATIAIELEKATDVDLTLFLLEEPEGVSPVDFESVYLRAERARFEFEESRFALKQYLAQHGCKKPEY